MEDDAVHPVDRTRVEAVIVECLARNGDPHRLDERFLGAVPAAEGPTHGDVEAHGRRT
jgi:hypothetical protein